MVGIGVWIKHLNLMSIDFSFILMSEFLRQSYIFVRFDKEWGSREYSTLTVWQIVMIWSPGSQNAIEDETTVSVFGIHDGCHTVSTLYTDVSVFQCTELLSTLDGSERPAHNCIKDFLDLRGDSGQPGMTFQLSPMEMLANQVWRYNCFQWKQL